MGSIPTFGTTEKTLDCVRLKKNFCGRTRQHDAALLLLAMFWTILGRLGVAAQVALVDGLQDTEARIARWSFSHGKDTSHW